MTFNVDVIRDTWRQLLDGPPATKTQPHVEIDCPDHGKTVLIEGRRTACCDSLQFVPSGRVTSRRDAGVAAEVIFR